MSKFAFNETTFEQSRAQMLSKIAAAFQVPSSLLFSGKSHEEDRTALVGGGYLVPRDFSQHIDYFIRTASLRMWKRGWRGLRRPDEI